MLKEGRTVEKLKPFCNMFGTIIVMTRDHSDPKMSGNFVHRKREW